MSTTHTNDASKLAEPDSGSSSGAAPPRQGMFRKLLSLLVDVAVYGASSLLSQIIGFVLLPVITHYLAPAEQGMATLVVTITAFFGPLGQLGIVNGIFRRFNVDKTPAERRRALSTGMFSVAASTLIVLTIGLCLAPQIAQLAADDPAAAQFLRLGFVSAAIASLGLVPLAMLRADRKVKRIAMINITKLLVSVGCTLVLVVGLERGVWGVLIGTLVGEVLTTSTLFVMTVRWFGDGFDWTTWKRLATYGFPLVPHQLQSVTYGVLAPMVVGKMLGLDQLGLYGTALKFTAPLVFVVNSVQNAWTAYKFQIHANDEDPAGFFRTCFTYYLAGVVYLWVGVSLWGPELLWLLADERYYPAAWLIPVAGLIPVAQGLYYMLGTGMEVSDNTRPFPLVSFLGLVTAAISAWLLIPRFGAAGAALAAASASLAMSGVIYYFSQRRFAIAYDWPSVAAIGVLGVLTVAVGSATLALPAGERVIVSLALSVMFPLLEFAILFHSRSERQRMRLLWSKFAGLRRKRSVKPALESAEMAAKAAVEEVA